MKAPRYRPSSLGVSLQRRIVMALLVALFAMVTGFLSYPLVRTYFYVYQLNSPRVFNRLRALNVLAKMAVGDASLRDGVEQAFVELYSQDEDQAAGVLLQLGSWSVGNVPTFKQRFLDRLDTEDDDLFVGLASALKEAGEWHISELPWRHRCRLARLRCQVPEAPLRAIAIHKCAEVGPECEPVLADVLNQYLVDESPAVRLAAVEAISICLPSSRVRLLRQALSDAEQVIREEAGARLELLTPQASRPKKTDQPSTEQLLVKLQSSDYFTQLEAIHQIPQKRSLSAQSHSELVVALQQEVRQGLAWGNGGLAGGALNALAVMDDRSYLPVMLDVAAGHKDQPMLRFMAGRAAARLDPHAGGGALINLFASDSDVIRDLAAIEIARLGDQNVLPRLQLELFSSEREVRGAAAFTLALMNQPDLPIRDISFCELLRKRTSLLKENKHAEPEWKPRGYYLCSRLIMGDADVREELELFLLNEHFPRLAIFIALLHTGDPSPLDMILLSDAYSDQRRMTLLRDMRFSDILGHYLPQAPRLEWAAPPDQRQRQMGQLVRWWSINRWVVQFDDHRQVFDVE